jgi:hypothetical protein
MHRNHLTVLVSALALAGVALAVAGCGGGGSKSSSAGADSASSNSAVTTKASGGASSGQNACEMLDAVVFDLGDFVSTGTGFDYMADKSFLDGYADRAPGGIASSVRQLRDLVDKIASAAQDAGVGVNEDPSEDQLHTMQDKLHFSGGDQAKNDAAVVQLTTYAASPSC